MSGEEWSIREFRALHAVITQRSITAADAWLGVSQPSVSRTLANLETRLGCLLFERSGRSVMPTEAAVRINERLMPFFGVLDDLRDERSRPTAKAKLRLAVPPAFANGYIQSVIASYLVMHPDTAVELDVRSSSVIVGEIADDLMEIGISDMPIETRNVSRRPICASQMACFMPASHPLALNETVALSALRGERLIALSRRHYARQKLDAIMASNGLGDQVRTETSTTLSALAFAEHGFGIALMNPFPAALRLPHGIVAVPLENEITYTTSFVHSVGRPLQRSTEAFVAHLRRALPQVPWLSRLPRQ